MKPESVNQEICRRCGACVEECGRGGIALEDGQIVFNGPRCMACGHCVAICPVGALTDPEGLPETIDRSILPSTEGMEELLRSRRSHRHYEKRPVAMEHVERLLAAARFAPSGKNTQSFEFTLLQTPDRRHAFTDACFERMIRARKKLKNVWWRFFVGLLFDPRVRDVGVRRSLDRALRRREAGMDPLFFAAPLIVLVHAPKVGATPKDDCCYALYHMVLMAETLGLGSCINGNAEVLIRHFPDLKKEVNIPDEHRVYACATFGYPKRAFVRHVHRNSVCARVL